MTKHIFPPHVITTIGWTKLFIFNMQVCCSIHHKLYFLSATQNRLRLCVDTCVDMSYMFCIRVNFHYFFPIFCTITG